MDIIEAHETKWLGSVRELFREYAAAIEVDLCFQRFSEELAGLPGQYAPPAGRLYLARSSGGAAGCAALRKIDSGACEMKRLYVRPAFRRTGLGRRLAVTVIRAARQAGYGSIRLDTLSTMKEALSLYASLGFQRIQPYYHNPNGDAVFMELRLCSTPPLRIGAPASSLEVP